MFETPGTPPHGSRTPSTDTPSGGWSTGATGPATTGDATDSTALLHPAVAALQTALTACAALEPDELSSSLDVAALARLAEQAQGISLRALGRFDARAGYGTAAPGAGTHAHATAAAWLHQVLGVSMDDARSRVRLSRRLTDGGDLQPVGDLLADGSTTVAHAGAVARGVRGLDQDTIETSAPAICALLPHLDPVALARELRERAHAVSEELAREMERRQRERRGLWLSRSTDGVGYVKGQLPALEADLLEEALARVVQRERAALDASGEPDRRDAAQRRADALATLARHALTSDSVDAGGSSGPLVGAAGTRAAITVLVTPDRLQGLTGAPCARTTSSAETVLSTSTLLELTCDADLSRVTLDTSAPDDALTGQLGQLLPATLAAVLMASPVALDLGRTVRTVTLAQWRALTARDRHCVIAGCHRPLTSCIAHHVQHWTRGGRSDLVNYALVCHQHHHEIHLDDTLWHRHHDGRWLTPDGYRPATARPPDLRSTTRYGPPLPSARSEPPF